MRLVIAPSWLALAVDPHATWRRIPVTYRVIEQRPPVPMPAGALETPDGQRQIRYLSVHSSCTNQTRAAASVRQWADTFSLRLYDPDEQPRPPSPIPDVCPDVELWEEHIVALANGTRTPRVVQISRGYPGRGWSREHQWTTKP